jgi:hypothetical protein
MKVMSEVENNETARNEEEFPLPPATFETLVRSLAAQVQFALMSFEGESGKHEPDLRVARHYIDMLGMLQEKTRGNLNLEEERLLGNSLTELRFRYIQAYEDSRRATQQKPAETESAQA